MTFGVSDFAILLVLVLAIGIGYFLGRRKSLPQTPDPLPQKPSSEYFEGLNYLLNEQPEEAIDTFVRALDVNSDTVETHLALGNLLRRRGEVDKATTVHRNLLARPELDRNYEDTVRLELARDFLAAGLLDRAERLLNELADEGGRSTRGAALEGLMDVYQREKDWQRAIETASRFGPRAKPHIQVALAHYHCAGAEQALAENDLRGARRLLQKALSWDEKCVRASLLLGQMELQLGRQKEAIKVLRRIRSQDPEFVVQSLPMLASAYGAMNNNRELARYLQQCLEETPSVAVLVQLVELRRGEDGEQVASSFLEQHLEKYPSVRGLRELVTLKMAHGEAAVRASLEVVQRSADAIVAGTPQYRCGNCGFSAKTLHWQCPLCKRWGSNKPVAGFSGNGM